MTNLKTLVPGTLLVFLALSACQLNKDNNPDSAKICCGSNPSQMVFKTEKGREFISWGEVTAVDVTISEVKGPAHQDSFSCTFTGDKALLLVKQLRLAWPRELGVPSSITTGQLVMHYLHKGLPEQTRTLTIQDGTLLEDSAFAEVTYYPGFTLDKKWIEAQN